MRLRQLITFVYKQLLKPFHCFLIFPLLYFQEINQLKNFVILCYYLLQVCLSLKAQLIVQQPFLSRQVHHMQNHNGNWLYRSWSIFGAECLCFQQQLQILLNAHAECSLRDPVNSVIVKSNNSCNESSTTAVTCLITLSKWMTQCFETTYITCMLFILAQKEYSSQYLVQLAWDSG